MGSREAPEPRAPTRVMVERRLLEPRETGRGGGTQRWKVTRREAYREEHGPLWDQLLRGQERQDRDVTTRRPLGNHAVYSPVSSLCLRSPMLAEEPGESETELPTPETGVQTG